MPGVHELALPLSHVPARLAHAHDLIRRGRVRAGLDALHLMRRDTGSTPLEPGDHAAVLAALVDCHLAQGDLNAAIEAGVDLTASLVREDPAGALAHHARGEIASALGEPDLALDHFLAAGRLEGPGDLPWRAGAALALVRLGRRREALDLARLHHARMLATGTAYDVAQALRTLATTDPDGHGPARLGEALVLLESADAPRLVAQIDTDLAGLLILGGCSDEALPLLRSAERYAGREELWPLQSRVRRLLDRLGEPPCRGEAETLAALTAAERRVAVLALDGLTNREIAEHLLVSVKAVEGHLSRVYRKLGVASRLALAASVGVPA